MPTELILTQSFSRVANPPTNKKKKLRDSIRMKTLQNGSRDDDCLTGRWRKLTYIWIQRRMVAQAAIAASSAELVGLLKGNETK